MCVNNLLKVVTWQRSGAESNLRLWVTSGLQVRHVTVRLPSHTNPVGTNPAQCWDTSLMWEIHYQSWTRWWLRLRRLLRLCQHVTTTRPKSAFWPWPLTFWPQNLTCLSLPQSLLVVKVRSGSINRYPRYLANNVNNVCSGRTHAWTHEHSADIMRSTTTLVVCTPPQCINNIYLLIDVNYTTHENRHKDIKKSADT